MRTFTDEKGELSIPSDQFYSNSVKVDPKGRILIPAEVRKSLGISPGDEINLYFKLSENTLFLKVSDERREGGASDD